ncbi:MAG: YraN family protein [Firmicutes bacterium]|nr:YraN family protein [Bacillota bacterium]
MAGEDVAVEELERRGYKILHRNWRCRLGELDIIALDGATLVFVEVKARRSSDYGFPAEFVDHRKRIRLERLARAFLTGAAGDLRDRPCRFDVVSVVIDGGRVSAVDVIVDAF